MKMKKIVLLFSMIAVLFSLTGCSDGQEKVDFEYTNTAIVADALVQSYQLQNADEVYRAYLADSDSEVAAAILNGVSNVDTAVEECGEYVGYRLKDGSSMEVDLANIDDETSAVLLNNIDAVVEEEGNTVVVKLNVAHADRDVVYTYIYERNPQYEYYYAMYQQAVNPFQVKEITAAPEYTFGEKMTKAAMNTLMGMGTVFIVLIFIAFVIGQFEKINKVSNAFSNWLANRKNKDVDKEVVEVVSESVSAAPVANSNPMDDSQLVAVITAAIVAANTASGGTDKLVVRSIRKAKR